jgi:hypothetical protein
MSLLVTKAFPKVNSLIFPSGAKPDYVNAKKINSIRQTIQIHVGNPDHYLF